MSTTAIKVLLIIAAVAIAAVLLSGCGTTGGLTVTPTALIAKVPVITPCIDAMPVKPAFMTDAQLLDGSDYQVVLNLRIDRDARRIYEAVVEAKMTACVKPVSIQ